MKRRRIILETLEHRFLLAAQPYDWKSVTIKGNGYIDGIVYSQAAPDVAYIHTDIGGAYRLDPTTNRWSPLNDWIQINDGIQNNGAQTFAVDPTDPNRVYMVAGTYQSSAAFLRSSDQGRTWQRTDVSSIKVDGNGWGRDVGERLAVDPNKPSVLFYGAQDYSATASGLWKSADSGASWNKISFPFLGDTWNGTYANANGVGLGFVVFDKSSGTSGSATPTIYVGVSSVTNVSNKIYRTTDSGATFVPIPNQPTTTLTPNRAVLSPDGGTMYVAYSKESGPYSNGATAGALYKVTNPNSANPTWTLVTPSAGAYAAVSFDPVNPNTVYAAVFDRYPDNIYRSTDGGSTWSALNPDNHRDNSSAAYANSLSTHWLTDLEVDPFNHNVAMYVTGYGIFRTTNLTAAAPTWSFYNDGFEQSAVLELVSPSSGSTHLLSVIGDRDGYKHDDFSVSPTGGRFSPNMGTTRDIDIAQTNVNKVVRVGDTSPYGQFSLNEGTSWSYFPTRPTDPTGSPPASANAAGNIAIAADGSRIIWNVTGPTSSSTWYSTNNGATWTGSGTTVPSGSVILSDPVNALKFYAYKGSTLYITTDGGVSWTQKYSGSNLSGTSWIRPVAGHEGDLWASRGGNGLWRSTDSGATWTRINSSAVTTANQVAWGAAPSAGGYPSIFIGGTVSGQNGFFRSDDQGATWTMISDLAHQYGAVTVIQGDPQVYGRLNVGTNGRGILYADIHAGPTTLPNGWNSADIGAPLSSGSAGQAGGTWEVIGGGAGVTGSADQFHFAYTALTGDGSITALVSDVPNGSPNNYSAKAGVMIRDGSAANSVNVFVGLTPGAASGAFFQTRAATGATTNTIANATVGVFPPYWVRLRRAGNQFTAFTSPDGINWSQLGVPQTIAMSATISIGLAVTASNNNQVDVSHFQNVSIAAAPKVVAAGYLYNTSLDKLSITFDQDVSASLLPADLTLFPGGLPATAVTWNAATLTATFTLPTPLEAGDYTATLSALATTNGAGDALASNYNVPFFILPADANRDRTVNALDFNVLANNYGNPGPNTLATGDFNFDGNVDSADFTILAQHFNTTLPAPAQTSLLLMSAPPTLFAARKITPADDLLEGLT